LAAHSQSFPLVCLYSFSQPWWIGIVGASLIGKWQSQKIPMFFLALTGAMRIEDPRVAYFISGGCGLIFVMGLRSNSAPQISTYYLPV
jgi:hypothetical protein